MIRFQGAKNSIFRILLFSFFLMISVVFASERQSEIQDAAFDAIKNNELKAIQSLIKDGLDPNYRLGEPRNLMRLSVGYNRPSILAELIRAGGNVDHKLKDNMYFVTYIAQRNDLSLLEPVLASNPDLNRLMYVNQYTAFTGMLRFINEKTLKYVVYHSNANVNFRPKNGFSSLYLAYERGECGLACVELLLEVGADPCLAIGPSGESFVTYLKSQKKLDVLERNKSYECNKDV